MSSMAEVNVQKLRELRKRRALSLQELGELAGVSYNSVWRIEHGKHGARPKTIRALAKALDVPVEELTAPEEVKS